MSPWLEMRNSFLQVNSSLSLFFEANAQNSKPIKQVFFILFVAYLVVAFFVNNFLFTLFAMLRVTHDNTTHDFVTETHNDRKKELN